jgi:hypothetical protein
VPDVIGDVRKALETRLRELEPLVKEHTQIREALEKLADAVGPGSKRTASSSTRRSSGAAARRGRPRGSGGRTQQALELIEKQPGITISEMAKKMGISPNYLYRVLPRLEAEKKIKKEGKGYYPIAD